MSLDYRNLNSQSRKMILGVYNYMEKEATEGVHNKNQIQLRTTKATNISVATLKRILKEAEQSKLETVFRTPGKMRKRFKKITGISDLDKCVIKRSIHRFHLIDKKWTSVNRLLEQLRSDINFQGSETSLRRIIKQLGFAWKKGENKTLALVEQYQIRLERFNFLKEMKQYRTENRSIIYTDEYYVQAPHNNSKTNNPERVVIVHAGSEAGFVPNALMTYVSDPVFDDYRNGINFEKYQNWLLNQLIPNLPPRSVVILDNTAHHNKEHDAAPNFYSKKCDMENWLSSKGIHFEPGMLKPQLYELIDLNKGCYKKYSVDWMLSQHGHDVLRLPNNQQDLNPMEQVWTNIKEYVNTKNAGWNSKQVMALMKEKIELIGPGEWKSLCDQVKVFEEDYLQCEYVMDQVTEDLMIKDDGGSDGSLQDAWTSDEEL